MSEIPRSKGLAMQARRGKERIGMTRYMFYWVAGATVTLAGYYLTRVLRSADIMD